MSAPFRLAVAAGSALLLAAGLAGCTGSPDASESSGSEQSSSELPTGTDLVGEYLTPDASNVETDMRKTQELIKECMEEQGFEYIAIKPGPVGPGTAPPSEPTRDWVAQHGDGNIEGHFLPNGERASEGDGVSNPNKTYYDGLSKAEQAAYDAALLGTVPATPTTLTWRDMGCTGNADHEVHPNNDEPQPPILDDVSAFLDSLMMNPKLTAIDEDVDACLAAEGQKPFSADPMDPDPRGDREFLAYLDKNPNATASDPEVVRLKKSEIARALAVWDCKDETDYNKRHAATLNELSKDFIAEHKKELEEAKLWLND